MDAPDQYPAIATIRLGNGHPAYAGTVREWRKAAEVWRCAHHHSTRSKAMRCAEREAASRH